MFWTLKGIRLSKPSRRVSASRRGSPMGRVVMQGVYIFSRVSCTPRVRFPESSPWEGLSMRFDVIGLSIRVFSLTLSALNDQPELQKQSDAHQMFLLRNVLNKHPRSSDFYAGEVACAFNNTLVCEADFK